MCRAKSFANSQRYLLLNFYRLSTSTESKDTLAGSKEKGLMTSARNGETTSEERIQLTRCISLSLSFLPLSLTHVSHEVMNLGGDLRYVTEEDYASFGGRQKRKEAWDVKTGWLGQEIFNNFNITHIQNGHTVFTHGDMEPEWARLGAETLNSLSRDAIWKGDFRHAPIFQGSGKCLFFWQGERKGQGNGGAIMELGTFTIWCMSHSLAHTYIWFCSPSL